MLSPVDMQNKVFKKNKIGGYSIEEVNEFVDEVIKSYQEIVNENYALKDKVSVLNESIQYYRTMETTIQNVLVLADKTAQDTKAAAYEKAEQIKKDGNQRAEKIVGAAEDRVGRLLEKGRQEAFELTQSIEEIKRQYMNYKLQFKQMLQVQLEMIERNEDKILSNEDETLDKEDNLTRKTPSLNDSKMKEAYEFAQIDSTEEDKFYTKEYMPIIDEELA